MSDASQLIAKADRAVAQGQLESARALLEQAGSIDGRDPSLFLKLAGLHRATADPDGALRNVHKALALEPRNFTALLMRASLLEQLGSQEADEAWSHAVAQLPDNPPEHLAAVIERAKGRAEQWMADREAKFAAAMAAAESVASEEEAGRLRRFRSNSARRTRTFHSSPTHFHFPELTEREFHPRRLFPWIDKLERHTDAIADELRAVMAAERAELVPYIEYPDHLPLDQWRALNRSRDWTAIHLVKNGVRVDANARHCPRALAIVEECDQPHIGGASPNVMFSLLAPNTAIPPHVGVNNARLVCHLPLVVPKGCWFRVGEQRRDWIRGEAFVFDDTIEHEALNPSNELRVVFIFDVWNPELSVTERDAVAAMIASDSEAGPGGL